MTFYARSDWRAAPAKADPGNFDPHLVQGVCIHYTGAPSAQPADVPAYFRAVQQHYLSGGNTGENYADIAYNVGVDRQGNVWELRGWTKRGGANGGTDSNAHYPSIFLVLGENDDIPQAMVDGVRAAITQYRVIYPSATSIHPHRDFYNTSCPGPAIPYITNGTFEPQDVHVASPEVTPPVDTPQPSQEDDEVKALYRWRDARFFNEWICFDNGEAEVSTQNTRNLYNVAVDVVEVHDQKLKSLCKKVGITDTDLVKAQ